MCPASQCRIRKSPTSLRGWRRTESKIPSSLSSFQSLSSSRSPDDVKRDHAFSPSAVDEVGESVQWLCRNLIGVADRGISSLRDYARARECLSSLGTIGGRQRFSRRRDAARHLSESICDAD